VTYRVAIDQTTGLHHVVDDRVGPVEEANKFLTALTIRGLSPNTIRAYAFDLLALYRWLDQVEVRLLDLKECDLLGFVADQRDNGARPRSINRRLTVCRLIYGFWTDEDMPRGSGVTAPGAHYRGSGRDKALGLRSLPKRERLLLRVKVPRTLVEPLTVEQVNDFLCRFRRYRDLVIVHLMLLCGLRSREVLALTLPDVSLEENRLHVRGKGDKERCLPLPQTVIDALSAYLRLERPRESVGETLFVVLQGRRRGRPMTRSGLRSLFRHRRRSAPGINNANPHRFRHTFGADMARAGVRLPILQRMMGHSSLTMTLQYVNLSMADIADEYRRAILKIDERYHRSESDAR